MWKLINKRKRDRSSVVIEICHSEPGAWKPASFSTSDCPLFSHKRSYHIGRTMFETDRIPDRWISKMNRMDEIWVPSKFMKDIFEKGGATNVRVIGESVDTTFFHPIPSLHNHASIGAKQDPANQMNLTRAMLIKDVFEPHPTFGTSVTIFLSVYKWEMRKGWDILLDEYFHSFTLHDPVSLFIITQEYHESGMILCCVLHSPYSRSSECIYSLSFLGRRASYSSTLFYSNRLCS